MSNKYQEALKFLDEYAVGSAVTSHSDMAIKQIKKRTKTLQELVDKETPRETIRTAYIDIYGNKLEESKTHYYNACPKCKDNVGIDANYCRHCGQKIVY